MPRVRELLDRFRPAGAPGAASGAGVPVDRRAGVEAELAPVFAGLDEVQRECARLRAAAAARAATRREEASAQAQTIVARARAGMQIVHAQAAADARRRAAAEVAEIAADAQRDADAVLRTAEQRRPALLGRVMSVLRDQLADLAISVPTPLAEDASATRSVAAR